MQFNPVSFEVDAKMVIRGRSLIVAILAVASVVPTLNACGTGGVSLDLRASSSNHRFQVKSIGRDLQFLMVHGAGYQVAKVPNVELSVTSQTSTSAVMRAGDGTQLSVSVVTDTSSLYLVKVSWTNLQTELWDCKELSEYM